MFVLYGSSVLASYCSSLCCMAAGRQHSAAFGCVLWARDRDQCYYPYGIASGHAMQNQLAGCLSFCGCLWYVSLCTGARLVHYLLLHVMLVLLAVGVTLAAMQFSCLGWLLDTSCCCAVVLRLCATLQSLE
jgi:hypothetical protein